MSKTNFKIADRILAVFLTVLMLFSMMPVSIFAGAASETDYIISVKDEESNPVSGATIAYAISVDGEKAEDRNTSTDENGVVTIDLSEYADEKAEEKVVTIDCTITKDGYVTKNTAITVDSLNGSKVVTLEEIESKTVNVSVSKNGNGTVKINGEENVTSVEKNSEVEIKVIPEDGTYIKSLTINGKEKTVAEGEGYTETVVASEEISVAVTFSTKYTVSVDGEIKNGKISLNGKNVASVTADKADKVNITVTPDKGYQIASVVLNGAEQLSSNATTFVREVSEATTVEATFVKVYEVTVTYNSNGTVITDTDPENAGGEVSVVSGKATIFEIGKKFQIIADPNENYRVSEVKINNEAVTDDENIGVNDKTYTSKKLDADKDYSITVTFSLNKYNVSVNELGNGSVSVNEKEVVYGTGTKVTIKPDKGYVIASTKINGVSVNTDTTDGETHFYVIKDIKEDKDVEVVFEKSPAAGMENVSWNYAEAVRFDETTNTYIFKPNSTVTLTTTYDGIRINEDKSTGVAFSTPVWQIKRNTNVEIIELYKYFRGWSTVTDNKGNNISFNIVFDETDPIAIPIPETNATNGYYNADIPVKVTVEDPGDFSGIKSVTYVVKNKGETTQEGTLYTYSEKDEIKGKITDLDKIVIESEKNNSADVKLIVTVTDRAGNSKPYEKAFKINHVAPNVTVGSVNGDKNIGKVIIDGELKDAAEANHFKKAKIIVKINDRPDTFNPEAAYNAVTILAEKKIVDESNVNYGEVVPVSLGNKQSMVSQWTPETKDGKIVVDENGNYNYVSTITLEDDGVYEVRIENYTNKAALSDNAGAIRNFKVDNTAPVGTISAEGNSWSELLSTITFGIFKNDKIEVTAVADDAISEVYDVVYYKDNGLKLLKPEDLEGLYAEKKFVDTPYVVGNEENAADERFVVYARLVDKAGNVTYIGTNGIIYDTTESTISEFGMPSYPEGQDSTVQIYNNSIEINVNVSEIPLKVLNKEGGIDNIYSGIKEVKYELIDLDNTDIKTLPKTIFKYEKANGKYVASEWVWNNGCYGEDEGEFKPVVSFSTLPTYEELAEIAEWNGKIRVDSEKFNSDRIKLIVTVTDNAGNVSEPKEKTFSINVDRPVVNIEIGKFNSETSTIETDIPYEDTATDTYGYYTAPRQAIVTLTERASVFNEANATNAIKITATDSKGTDLGNIYTTDEEWSHDGDKHSMTVYFKEDANYTFSFEGYVNNAMNTFEVSDNTYSTVGNTVNEFTVDTTDPTGTVTVLGNTWNKLLNKLTFGLFGNANEYVTVTSDDATSPINKVEFYRTSNPVLIKAEELDEFYKNGQFKDYYEEKEDEGVLVETDSQFVFYFRIEDNAGKYTYINSDGAIIDANPSSIKLSSEDEDKHITLEAKSYNKADGDVTVDITVEEATENYSGIQQIEYWVIKDSNTVTQQDILYSFDFDRDTNENNLNINGGKLTETDMGVSKVTDGNVPTQDMLKQSWTGSIDIDCVANNSCNVVVYVKVTDNSGNAVTESKALDIDITAPVIDVEFDNNTPNMTVEEKGYYASDRTATVTITERDEHFDPDAAFEGIKITATDINGEKVTDAFIFSEEWTLKEGTTPDKDTHTATIHFAKDANYTFDISYTDKAGNANGEVRYVEGAQTPNEFAVDTAKPFGTVTATSKEGRENQWDKRIEDLTFGFWSKEEISISSTSGDATSPIAKVEYYIVEAKENAEAPVQGDEIYVQEAESEVTEKKEYDASVALTETELDAVKNWKILEDLSITKDKRFTVYLKITDNAGNYEYISTDGLIVDHKAPDIIEVVGAPEVTIQPEVPDNGIFNGDVKVAIKVEDPLVNGAYSGLKTITYKVYNKAESLTVPTQTETLYDFKIENPKQDQLQKVWTGTITVESDKNNSNDIVVEVIAEDNSLNTSREEAKLMIDTTAPKISVSYNNNKVDSKSFFKADRTAKIVITERNFNPDDVVIDITNTDGKAPEITNWVKTPGKAGNLDDTKWTTTVTYDKDGDYTFDIEYTDLADNACDGADYGKSKAPQKFTIDKTAPTVSVSYNNNSAKNGKYFASGRTATIVINEHNFDINRINFIRSSKLDGKNISTPSVSWNHSGDVHTATINYTADGDYTFDVEVMDKAGNKNKAVNYGSSVAGKDFTIDKTPPTLKITGVANGKAYKGAAEPTISFSDTNYDNYDVRILRTRMGDKNAVVTNKFGKKIPVNAKGGTGTFNTFKEIAENDGIYTLTVEVIDKAGNKTPDTVKFTLNRFGSVYEYSDYLVEKIEEIYTKSIDKDLVITEYNADRLLGGSLNIEVTCDGKPMSDVKYDVSPVINETVAVGSSGWFQYAYTLSKDNFESDGVYKIFVSSEDATGNKPENSNYEDKAITFMVDSTAPEITSITGLEKEIVNATEQEVKYTIFDTIGLKSIKIIIDGVQVGDTITDFSADMNNYSGSFKLTEKTTAQTVQILVEDTAGNITDTDSETFTSEYVFNSKATVSTNFFVRWFANKPLFFGSIAAIIALIAVIIFIIVKRRKKDEE